MRKKIYLYICKRKTEERETNTSLNMYLYYRQRHLYGESLESSIAYFVYFQSLNFASVSDMRTPAEVDQGATPKVKMKGILIKDMK